MNYIGPEPQEAAVPGVTAEDPLVLPKADTAPEGHEDEGFPVRRAFAGIHTRHPDPFRISTDAR